MKKIHVHGLFAALSLGLMSVGTASATQPRPSTPFLRAVADVISPKFPVTRNQVDASCRLSGSPRAQKRCARTNEAARQAGKPLWAAAGQDVRETCHVDTDKRSAAAMITSCLRDHRK